MTDRKPTDLSYGHPGQATYDVEEKQWIFSRSPEHQQEFRQISPYKECFPASIQNLPQTTQLPSVESKFQLKKILKANPDFVLAKDILSTLVKFEKLGLSNPPDRSGNILATGYADSPSKNSRFIALPCGEAGHILKLVRLRKQALAWGSRSGPSISLDSTHGSDEAFWMGTGGVIRQIAVCDDSIEASPWLAVRQDTLITVFYPTFGKPYSVRKGVPAGTFPLSRLNANPVASMATVRHDSEIYIDISFNPWYNRQFILIDTLGRWSVWNIEGNPKSSRLSVQLVADKTGSIHHDSELDAISSVPARESTDGWYKAFWISDLSTIANIDRSQIVIIDLKGQPKHLRSIKLKSERILDTKKNPADHNQLFVLTSSRIILVHVTPAGDGEGEEPGARIILSQRHFRDSLDRTLRLCIVQADLVSIAVFSSQTQLINVYGFLPSNDSTEPTCWQSSFLLSTESSNKGVSQELISALLLKQVEFEDSADTPPQISEGSLVFIQAWGLSHDLALGSAVLVAHQDLPQMLKVAAFWKRAPTFRVRKQNRGLLSEKYIQDDFILLDAEDDQDVENQRPGYPVQNQHLEALKMRQNDLRRRVNWTKIFKIIFPNTSPKSLPDSSSPSTTMDEIITHLDNYINQAKASDGFPLTTIYELLNHSTFSEELDGASTALHGYIQSLQNDAMNQHEFTLTTLALTTPSLMSFPAAPSAQALLFDFLNIYDQLVTLWIADLPSQVSVPSRLQKHKMVRQIAIDLGLSSVGVSYLKSDGGEEDVENSTEVISRRKAQGADDDSGFFSPEMTPVPSQHSLYGGRTTTRTPSVYSHATNASSETSEDPAISRLRKYAVTIASGPDPGRSKILSQWTVGGDPSAFSWEDFNRASVATESADENSRKKRREDLRRQKLTEKYLSRQSSRATTVEPQPLAIRTTDSQPGSRYNFSSQPESSNLPMTQPDRGAFGSRAAQKGKKKKRAAGF
ncbi:hypothetical protein GLAREA_03226 [Glarea lozoyensis ATCC 20868]|uniref:RNA polymerase I-specific transcription initiation factor RRN6-like protein n=1 Tax=Glarea lozoyensis (strain ATCC 20868 / MF5171) TaxID=1116229 RepID=S3D5H2_GLAL2|nr:uncharacterized protein GLAREA_03226 [Glarea lozoyensis ATCC 20868]EPE27311.1 hypothetical protein GLAREA_03226 [Glarea lozoyensis ATCC 20868]